jgi:hypothetical protein
MTSWNLLFILVTIIILFVILIGFWLYSSNLRQKMSQSSTDYDHQPDLDLNMATNNIDIGNDLNLGNLFESCPCKKGLVCDSGICKMEPNTICVTSSTCPSNYICYTGRCLEKPSSTDEIKKTNYQDDQICLNRHFLKLDNTKFNMMSGWWNINQGISLCESDVSGVIYVVTENELYRVSIDSKVDSSVIHQNLQISKMFRFVNKIHVLTNDGRIYQLVSETHRSQWEYRRINEIYGKDLSNTTVDDAFPCKDGSLALRIDGKIYMYSTRHRDRKWKMKKGATKVIYDETSLSRAIMYPNKIVVKLAPPSDHRQGSLWNPKTGLLTGNTESNEYNKPLSAHDDLKTAALRKLREGKMGKSRRDKESLSVIPGKFKDMIFSGNGQGILVISLSDSTVTEYVKTWSNRLQEKILNGTGDKLFKCFRDIWLLTGASCSNI